MSIDFNDPTTWDQPLTQADAISMAIFGLNTLAHPEGSNLAQFAALDFFTEGAIELLAKMRDEEAWVVEIIYSTDPENNAVPDDDWTNRTLHGPFPNKEAADEWDEGQPEDEDVKEVLIFQLNDPAERPVDSPTT